MDELFVENPEAGVQEVTLPANALDVEQAKEDPSPSGAPAVEPIDISSSAERVEGAASVLESTVPASDAQRESASCSEATLAPVLERISGQSPGSGSSTSTLPVCRFEVVFSSVPPEVRQAALSTGSDIIRESTLSTLRFAISTLKTVDVSELWLRANFIFKMVEVARDAGADVAEVSEALTTLFQASVKLHKAMAKDASDFVREDSTRARSAWTNCLQGLLLWQTGRRSRPLILRLGGRV